MIFRAKMMFVLGRLVGWITNLSTAVEWGGPKPPYAKVPDCGPVVSSLDCFVGDFLFGGVVFKMKPWKSMGPKKMVVVCVFEQRHLQIFGRFMKKWENLKQVLGCRQMDRINKKMMVYLF